LTDTWEDFGNAWPYSLVAVTGGKYKERYLFTVGGLNYQKYFGGSEDMINKMLMLDTEEASPKWF